MTQKNNPNQMMVELTDEELKQVYGGNPGSDMPSKGGAQAGNGLPIKAVKLTGVYYSNSDGTGTAYTFAVGWSNLFAMHKEPTKYAGYLIMQLNEKEPIGWAPKTSLEFL